MEFVPGNLTKDGMHYHMPEKERLNIYQQIITFINSAWQPIGNVPIIALCKETKSVRETLSLNHDHCNCE